MQKAEILRKIHEMAEQNGGKPPGALAFYRATGASRCAWNGKYWLRWSEALREAGFPPNTLVEAYSHEFLMRCLAEVAREHGRFPIVAALDQRHRRDATFPCAAVFYRRGLKQQLVRWLWEFCRSDPAYQDVALLCAREIEAGKHRQHRAEQRQARQRDRIMQRVANKWNIQGVIYLLRCEGLYKIGHTSNLKRRRRELETQSPGRLKLVHRIKTDDPPGLEAYWHKRFRDKRVKGEWFQLTRDDVAVFKLRLVM